MTRKSTTALLTLSMLLSAGAANADAKLDIGLRLEQPFVTGEAPKLLPWPDLPRAVQIVNGRIFVKDSSGSVSERHVDEGLYLPQELAWEYYARLATLEQYPDVCQTIMDASTRLVYTRMQSHIDQQDAWIAHHKAKRFTLTQALVGSFGVLGIGVLSGAILGTVAF